MAAILALPPAARAVSFSESFTGTTAPGWEFGGLGSSADPVLTANTVDSDGTGWLRMTGSENNQATYALWDNSVFSVNAQIQIEMEYTFWNGHDIGGAQNGVGADGLTFFLLDASVDSGTFQPGSYGGSLGYAALDTDENGSVDSPGMAGGYLGFGFDNWGNYSGETEGRDGGLGTSLANGSTTGYPNRIAVRGPDDGDANNATGWEFIEASAPLETLSGGGQMDFPTATSRPDQTGANYRSFRLTLDASNLLVVEMKFGMSADYIVAFTADLSDYERPDYFKLGFTAGTGGANETHEIRNLTVNTTPFASNNYEWDNGGGATKTWSTGSNWVGDSAPSTHADLLFRNASPAVSQTATQDGNFTVRSLNFESSRNHTLNGAGTITLGDGVVGNAPSINVTQSGADPVHHKINNNLALAEAARISNNGNAVLCLNGTYTTGGYTTLLNGDGSINFNGLISGSGAIIKNGSGITTINKNNTGWTGPLTVNEGVVAISTNGALGTTASGTSVNSDGALFLRNVNYSTTEALSLAGTGVIIRGPGQSGALHADGGVNTFAGAITLAGDAAIGARDGSTLTLSGVIADGSGNRSLTKVGDGLVSLTGTNTYGGDTIVSGGALRVTTGSLPGGYNTSDTGNNYGAVILGGGVLELATTGTSFTRDLGTGEEDVAWSGDGGFSASGGSQTVLLAGDARLTWASTGSFVGNTYALLLSSDHADSTLTFDNNISFNSAQREVRVADGSAAIDAVLSGNLRGGNGNTDGSGGLVKTGEGTLSLTGTNDYNGATEIRAGALRGSIGSDSNLQLNGGVREVSANTALTLGASGGNVRWTGAGGFAAVGGAYTLNLSSGAALAWGDTNFISGTNALTFGSVSANNTLTLTNNLSLGATGTDIRTIRTIKGTSATVASGGLSGVVSGAATLAVTGNGRLDLTGNNTHTGAVTITGSEVRLSGASGDLAQSSGFIVRQGGALSFDSTGANHSSGDRVANTAISLQGASLNLYGRTGNNDTTETIGTVTLASGANTINAGYGDNTGSAQLTLSGLSRTAGATVNFTHLTAAGAAAGTLGGTGDNSRILVTGLSNTNGILGGWATVGDNWAMELNDTQGIAAFGTGTINGASSGAYETSTTSGDWASTENVSIAGNATVNGNRDANTFRLNGTGAARTLDLDNDATSRTLTLTSGGILSVGANTNIITADNAGSSLRAGGSSDLVVHTQGSTNTLQINAQIANNSGGNGLTKAGDGTLLLGGTMANTYTGTTTVNAGTLVLDKSDGVTAVAGNLVVGDGRGIDTVRLDSNEQIADTATVTLTGGEIGNNANVARLQLNGAANDTIGSRIESFDTLHITGNTILDFDGGTPCSPTFLYLDEITGDGLLTITNWIEFTDYLLVEKTSFDAGTLPRIVFDGYPGAWSYQNYDSNYYQITPVPEPATYGLLALGGLTAFATLRRRRVRTAAAA